MAEKFVVLSKDKTTTAVRTVLGNYRAAPQNRNPGVDEHLTAGLIKRSVYRDKYNDHDLARHLIVHYQRQHIYGHTMQSVLIATNIRRVNLCVIGRRVG